MSPGNAARPSIFRIGANKTGGSDVNLPLVFACELSLLRLCRRGGRGRRRGCGGCRFLGGSRRRSGCRFRLWCAGLWGGSSARLRLLSLCTALRLACLPSLLLLGVWLGSLPG